MPGNTLAIYVTFLIGAGVPEASAQGYAYTKGSSQRLQRNSAGKMWIISIKRLYQALILGKF